jgi:para-aminobenzoate synthetase/4-amino-4-deoxychorismate lyase
MTLAAPKVAPTALRVALDCDRTALEALLALRDDPLPFALVGAWAGGGAIVGSAPLHVLRGAEADFDVLHQPPVDGPAGMVGGGWFGHLGFALARSVERLAPGPPRPVPRPQAALAYHDHVLRQDPDGRWWFEALVTEAREAALHVRLAELRDRLAAGPSPQPFAADHFAPRAPGYVGHRAAIAACVERIAAGEIFQANLCLRFEGRLRGAPIDAFAAAADRLRPRYGAFFGDGAGALLSLSPELFLRRTGTVASSAPIKGTAARSGDPAAAAAERARLGASAKDRAEHVMIVDLMRNDLGRVARYGSVHAAPAPEVQAHPDLWHLVSVVRGELRDGVTDADLLRATFPPGSVTGAPKVQALQVISDLEATAREAYTGAIGYASPVAGLELNVAIRTFEVAGERIWLGAGGGIVADSDPDAEVAEAHRKALPLVRALGAGLQEPPPPAAAPAPPGGRDRVAAGPRPDPAHGLLETIAVRGGVPVALDAHLARLERSARVVLGRAPAADLAERARALAATAPVDPARLRIVLDSDGAERLELGPSSAPAQRPVTLVPLALPGGLGEHKWADRRLVDAAPPTALLCDLDGAVLEAAWGNVWAVEGDALLTPPADGRLLPGVTRARLLERVPAAREAPLTLDRLAAADAVLVSSSLRLVTPAALEGRPAGTRAAPLAAALREELAA